MSFKRPFSPAFSPMMSDNLDPDAAIPKDPVEQGKLVQILQATVKEKESEIKELKRKLIKMNALNVGDQELKMIIHNQEKALFVKKATITLLEDKKSEFQRKYNGLKRKFLKERIQSEEIHLRLKRIRAESDQQRVKGSKKSAVDKKAITKKPGYNRFAQMNIAAAQTNQNKECVPTIRHQEDQLSLSPSFVLHEEVNFDHSQDMNSDRQNTLDPDVGSPTVIHHIDFSAMMGEDEEGMCSDEEKGSSGELGSSSDEEMEKTNKKYPIEKYVKSAPTLDEQELFNSPMRTPCYQPVSPSFEYYRKTTKRPVKNEFSKEP